MFENVDTQCGSISIIELKGLSFFDSAFSLLLFFITFPVNVLILIGIVKYKPLFNRNYYVIIFNIAIADLIMGLVADPLSVSFHLKEALEEPIPSMELKVMHFIIFLTNSVALFSMILLTIDRLGVILSPFSYYGNVTKPRIVLLLVGTWVLSISISVVYFFIGYIRFLVIFACSAVGITLSFMVVTMLLLRHRLSKAKDREVLRRNSARDRTTSTLVSKRSNGDKFEFTKMDEKVTRTFLYMLLLFIINYLPCIVLTLYMNICTNCDCQFVHVMRDIVFLSILSTSAFRAVNFLFRLESLRKAVKGIFNVKSNEETEIIEAI